MSSIEPKDPLFSEAELKRVLELWVAPGPSRKLDERVSNSYCCDPAGGAPPEPKRGSDYEVLFHMSGRVR